MTRRKTNEEFIKEIYDLVGNEYTFLEPYINNRIKLKVRHNVCGNTYSVSPSNFLIYNSRCPYCAVNRQYTATEFAFKMHQINSHITILDKYRRQKTKIKVRCNDCGHTWYAWPGILLTGSGCPKCAIKARSKAKLKPNEQFLSDVKEQVSNEYTFLEPYIRSNVKLKVRHNTCGTVYLVSPNNFFKGRRCPYCTNRIGGPVWKNILYTKETGWLDEKAKQECELNTIRQEMI